LCQIAATAIKALPLNRDQMRKLNCRPGDLTITVEAFNPINIGSIVRVLDKHYNQSLLSIEPDDFLWYAEAAH